MIWKFTIIESPFSGDEERNLKYVRAAMRDCFRRGEIPLASHALYTQPGVLDDNDPEERRQGMHAGFNLRSALCLSSAAEVTIAFYTDLGWSGGMVAGRDSADVFFNRYLSITGVAPFVTEERTIPGWEKACCDG